MNFVYLILGILIYTILDVATFREGLPKKINSDNTETKESIPIVLAQYFNLNFFYVLGGGIVGVLLVMLLQSGGFADMGFVVAFFNSIGINPDNSPASIAILGLLNQWLFIKLRKYFKSMVIQTDMNNEVKLAKDA